MKEMLLRGKGIKRVLCFVLCLVMCLSLMPVTAFAADVVNYNVWVKGEQFTSENLTIECGSGTATFSPSMNVLTLDDAQIIPPAESDQLYKRYGIYTKQALTVVVNGENTIGGITGIYSLDGDITICGDGSIAEEAGIFCNNGDVIISENVTLNIGSNASIPAQGINCMAGDVNMSTDGDVKIAASRTGIAAYNNVIISGAGQVDITAGASYTGTGINAVNGDVEISGSNKLTIKAIGGASASYINQAIDAKQNVLVSGERSIDLSSNDVSIVLESATSSLLLNGTASTISIRGNKKAVLNKITNESPVAGTNIGKYVVTGNPASTSVIYSFSHEHDFLEQSYQTDDTGKHYQKCKICEADSEHEECTPGTAVKEDVVAPTCIANGSHNDVVYCTICNQKLNTTPETDLATGTHDFSKYVSLGNGKHKVVCKTCDTVQTGHENDVCNGTWQATKQATALAAGVNTKTCSLCKGQETAPIAKLTPTIKLSKTKLSLKKGKSASIKVSQLANGDSVKSWKTSNKKVATVSSKGKIKAKKKGKATITVTLASGMTAKVKVTVK